MSEPVLEREAVAAYHGLLEDDGVASASIEALREGQRERRLVFGEHPLCVSVRPQLVSRARYREAVAAAQTVASALGSLERALLRDADLRRELDLDPVEEELALADPGCKASSPSARIDGFFSDTLRFVEYNAESPAGMAYTDNLSAVFESMPVLQSFRRRYRLRRLPVAGRQVEVMLRAFSQWGRGRSPFVAIVDWRGLPTVAEFEMFREEFERRGIPCLIADPSELSFHGGALRCRGKIVNLVYRRVLTTELLGSGEPDRALRDAYLAGAACVVNTFRAKLLHKKMSLALLSDERYSPLYSARQRGAIDRHVPWTRKLREGQATRHGKGIRDLAAYAARHRHELVLKPNDEYGGKGVVLGWTVEQHEWEQALTVGLSQSYVLQEAVPIPREEFPVALDAVELLDLAVDMDPYLFEGRASGALTRLSSSALLNVTAGAGSVVPTYVLEGPA